MVTYSFSYDVCLRILELTRKLKTQQAVETYAAQTQQQFEYVSLRNSYINLCLTKQLFNLKLYIMIYLILALQSITNDWFIILVRKVV